MKKIHEEHKIRQLAKFEGFELEIELSDENLAKVKVLVGTKYYTVEEYLNEDLKYLCWIITINMLLLQC